MKMWSNTGVMQFLILWENCLEEEEGKQNLATDGRRSLYRYRVIKVPFERNEVTYPRNFPVVKLVQSSSIVKFLMKRNFVPKK